MNVLVLGWYHHRNAGDDRIQVAITRWLDGHTLGFLPAGRRLPTSFVRRWDVVLIGGGGLLQRRGGALRDLRGLARRARVPVGLVGVSAEHPDAELVSDLRRAAPALCFLWSRDQGTLDELGLVAGPRTFVAPDLTWLAPVAGPRALAGGRRGIAVATAPHAGLDPETWGPALGALPAPVRPWPFWDERRADAKALETLLPGVHVPGDHDLAPGREARVVVSARYHGLVFGLQMGHPVVGIGDAPKVVRLLDEQGLGEWHVPADRPDRLGPVVASVLADQAHAERRVAEVARRLGEQATAAAQRALDLLEADARPLDGRSHLRRVLRLA